jgi:hypothetical protein
MSEWDVRYESSAFKTSIESALAALDTLPEEESADSLESIARLKKVVTHARAIASELDPELISPSMLQGGGERAGLIKAEIEAYATDHDASHLGTANGHGDSLLDTMAAWTFIPVAGVEGLGETISSFRRSAGQLMRGIRDDDSATRQKLEEIKREGETVREAVKNESDEVRRTISAEAEAARAKLTELEGQIANEKTRLDSVFSTFESESSVAQEKVKNDTTEALAQQLAEVKKQGDAIEQRGLDLVAEIDKLKTDAEVAAGAIGVTGLTEGFMKYADAQRRVANVWSGVVVGPLVAIVGIAIWIIAETKSPNTVNLRTYIAKFLVSVPLAAVAGYAAQQSSKHRANERHARKLQLELSSLNSFLAPLPEPQQLEIKKSVADRIFGRPDEDIPIDKVGANQLADMLAKLIEALAKKL